MNNTFLVRGSVSEEILIKSIRPELNRICCNPIRASIIHMLVRAKNLNYSLSVEEIAHRLGKRHSVIIFHLEKLLFWKVVKVVKAFEHGSKSRRSIWGLNMRYPNLIQNIYAHILSTFYTSRELDNMCCVNKNVRNV